MDKTNYYSGLNPIVVQALNNLQYRYSGETPEMWYSRVRYPFKKFLEYNPKYFSKNGFIQMIERSYIDGEFKAGRRSFHIYCTVCDSLVIIRENTIECANDHLNKCITKTAKRLITYSKPVQKNVKKIVSELSDDEINEIYDSIYFRYRKSSECYCSRASKEIRKSTLRPETWAKQVWNIVRNDGTPDRKKYLGIFSLVERRINSQTQEEYDLHTDEYQGYRIVTYGDWSLMLKCLANSEYHRISKVNNNIVVNFVKSSEYARYMCKKAGKQYLCDSLEIDYFKSEYSTIIEGKSSIIDFSDFNNNCDISGRLMKRSWEFLIPKYYNYGFKNFYATVIQRAYRNYKKRPESSAKQVWEAVRNDGTPDRKKFLGILGYYQKVKNPETQEEYVIACEEFYAYFRKYYSKYIGIINPIKLTPPYEEYVYCSSSRWIEAKKHQLERRLNRATYGPTPDFSGRFLLELLSTINYYHIRQMPVWRAT
ncbi:hypothetical protein RhiirB3_453333 [Rhizophagus irregularis]|nr:hypothetical protein RhiirB3_453333 [Rhizophagus irregularis]